MFKAGDRVALIVAKDDGKGARPEKTAFICTVDRVRNNRVELVGDDRDFCAESGLELRPHFKAGMPQTWGTSWICPVVEGGSK